MHTTKLLLAAFEAPALSQGLLEWSEELRVRLEDVRACCYASACVN